MLNSCSTFASAARLNRIDSVGRVSKRDVQPDSGGHWGAMKKQGYFVCTAGSVMALAGTSLPPLNCRRLSVPTPTPPWRKKMSGYFCAGSYGDGLNKRYGIEAFSR